MENSNLQRDKLDMQGRFNGLEEENEVLADRLDTCDVWVKYTLQFMTKQGRNEFYSASRAACDSLRPIAGCVRPWASTSQNLAVFSPQSRLL